MRTGWPLRKATICLSNMAALMSWPLSLMVKSLCGPSMMPVGRFWLAAMTSLATSSMPRL